MGELEGPHQKLGEGGAAIGFGQVVGFGVSNQTVVDQWQPVPEGFEFPPPADLLRGIQLIKAAALNRFQDFAVDVVEFVEDHIQPGAFGALCSCLVPEFHAPIVFEDVFDDKPISQENKENRPVKPASHRKVVYPYQLTDDGSSARSTRYSRPPCRARNACRTCAGRSFPRQWRSARFR